MKAVTHLEKVIAGETSAVTHLEKVIAQETAAVTYTEKVIAGIAPPITHLQKVIAGEARPVTHLEYVWAGGSPPSVQEYTGAVPVTFVADGTPLLDYIISGNTVQSGTPTPDNPIMPQGTGERTGNLYNINANDVTNGYVNSAQLNQDGTTETWESAEISEYIPISGDTAYTFNGIGSYNSPCYGLYDENKQLIGAYRYNGAQIIKFTSPNNARYFRFTHIKIATRAMMVEGTYTTSTMPDYEPYGYKIPISSANTTTPTYLGEVETTRRIKKFVLTGKENIRIYSGAALLGFELNTTDMMTNSRQHGICTHFKPQQTGSGLRTDGITFGENNKTLYITLSQRTIDTFDLSDIQSISSWLAAQYTAGTPVTVWYVLATPETGIVNEPLMKIGDYADTLSKEQAGVSIPTANGSTTLDVETTVPPSEIYIKYRGEAVATLSMLSTEVSGPEAATEEDNPEETEEEENGSEDVSLQYKPEAIE